jgi:hypothetical protein
MRTPMTLLTQMTSWMATASESGALPFAVIAADVTAAMAA